MSAIPSSGPSNQFLVEYYAVPSNIPDAKLAQLAKSACNAHRFKEAGALTRSIKDPELQTATFNDTVHLIGELPQEKAYDQMKAFLFEMHPELQQFKEENLLPPTQGESSTTTPNSLKDINNRV